MKVYLPTIGITIILSVFASHYALTHGGSTATADQKRSPHDMDSREEVYLDIIDRYENGEAVCYTYRGSGISCFKK